MQQAMTNDQEVVVELLKTWMEKHDIALLAKENQIVFWENEAWVMWTMKEAVNIFKATLIPFGLMKICDDNAVRIAALELNRSYIAGVNSPTVIQPQYFNLHRNAVKLGNDFGCYKEEIVRNLISHCESRRVNILLTDLGRILDFAMSYLEQPKLSSQERNDLIRKAIVGTQYKERNYNSRYLWDGRMHAVIRYGKASGLCVVHAADIEAIVVGILTGTQAAKKFATGFKRDLLNVALGR
ncbi:hypothetical protein QDY63_14585 [Pseudomonas brenneri]|uniref:hypothetical protein n=1 Tax=Pseudomonas brenneri TaxID=129817 RepID=UPI0025A23B51|nr:hypothetical protein [Pseudomonas brenneri]WJM94040.1 hypothetical protein QDY63_14585 [Pseudomonas brenneri]